MLNFGNSLNFLPSCFASRAAGAITYAIIREPVPVDLSRVGHEKKPGSARNRFNLHS